MRPVSTAIVAAAIGIDVHLGVVDVVALLLQELVSVLLGFALGLLEIGVGEGLVEPLLVDALGPLDEGAHHLVFRHVRPLDVHRHAWQGLALGVDDLALEAEALGQDELPDVAARKAERQLR